ncbi:hypothetical protein M8494_00830 [Serratia ureilytica]
MPLSPVTAAAASKTPRCCWWTAAIWGCALVGIGGLATPADPWAGERHQRQTLAGFDAQTVHLRALGMEQGVLHPMTILKGRAFVVRRLCAGKFRPALSRR